jgi:hypothetical protein
MLHNGNDASTGSTKTSKRFCGGGFVLHNQAGDPGELKIPEDSCTLLKIAEDS